MQCFGELKYKEVMIPQCTTEKLIQEITSEFNAVLIRFIKTEFAIVFDNCSSMALLR